MNKYCIVLWKQKQYKLDFFLNCFFLFIEEFYFIDFVEREIWPNVINLDTILRFTMILHSPSNLYVHGSSIYFLLLSLALILENGNYDSCNVLKFGVL